MSKLKLGLQMWSIHDVFVNQGFEKCAAGNEQNGL